MEIQENEIPRNVSAKKKRKKKKKIFRNFGKIEF